MSRSKQKRIVLAKRQSARGCRGHNLKERRRMHINPTNAMLKVDLVPNNVQPHHIWPTRPQTPSSPCPDSQLPTSPTANFHTKNTSAFSKCIIPCVVQDHSFLLEAALVIGRSTANFSLFAVNYTSDIRFMSSTSRPSKRCSGRSPLRSLVGPILLNGPMKLSLNIKGSPATEIPRLTR